MRKQAFINSFCIIYSRLAIFLILFFNIQLSAQLSEGWETTKQGGIGFKIGGIQPMDKIMEYSELFNSRDYNFCFSLGLGRSELEIEGYVGSIKLLQSQGHALLDITPNVRTNYFLTKFDPSGYLDQIGVDHVIGNKICLQFDEIDESERIREGNVTVQNNMVYGNGFEEYGNQEIYIYFPTLEKLVLIDEIITSTSARFTDVWGDSINLGFSSNLPFYNFNLINIHLTKEALLTLGNESLKLSELYGLERPYTFIPPGSALYPTVTPDESKLAMGDQLGYTSAQSYPPYNSIKCYNEFDPDKTKSFGMLWGDFDEDNWTLAEVKKKIADDIAKRRVLLNRTYFTDGANYIYKTESLLDWCIENNIPIKTFDEWREILYDTKQNPYIDIFPKLNVDLDNNDVPDGYIIANTAVKLDKEDGAPASSNYSLSLDSQGQFFSISGLGGLEKGENSFEFWTKGGNANVTFYFYVGENEYRYEFPANDSAWVKYDLSNSNLENKTLFIPDSISTITFSAYSTGYVSGEIKISGMSLRSAEIDTLPPSKPVNLKGVPENNNINLSWNPNAEDDIYLYRIYRSDDPNFNPDSSIVFSESRENYFIDESLEYSGNYAYRVAAVDFAGNVSEYSDSILVLVEVDVEDKTLMIENYELSQNYPNPFNPSTYIKFTIPELSYVKIKVFDIIGREITKLVDNYISAGFHEVKFESSNLSSGVYFYRIEAKSVNTNNSEFVNTKKMLLMK